MRNFADFDCVKSDTTWSKTEYYHMEKTDREPEYICTVINTHATVKLPKCQFCRKKQSECEAGILLIISPLFQIKLKMRLYYEYLGPSILAGFDTYKYRSKDTSPLSNYVMHPFWNQVSSILTYRAFSSSC